jgi:hypothetical protein
MNFVLERILVTCYIVARLKEGASFVRISSHRRKQGTIWAL